MSDFVDKAVTGTFTAEDIEADKAALWNVQAWASRAASNAVNAMGAPGLAFGSHCDPEGGVLAVAVVFTGPDAADVLSTIQNLMSEIEGDDGEDHPTQEECEQAEKDYATYEVKAFEDPVR